MEFKDFISAHTAKIEPLEREGSLAYWEAARSGREDDFRRFSMMQMKLEEIYTNRDEFAYVKSIRDSGGLRDERLKRMADLLYFKYLGNQIDPGLLRKIVDLSSRAENAFSVFRAEVDGKVLSTNEVYSILRESHDSEYRRKVWEANKSVGAAVVQDLLELVRLRNLSASEAGFGNYYSMSLALAEQDEGELAALFDELEKLTRKPYLKLKGELDSELARSYGVGPAELRPWHYHDPYFQEAPSTGQTEIDKYYRGKDIAEIAAGFFASLGMPVEDILSRSDLYEREGKNPHAFCSDIDRMGDIRILANLEDNHYWMETMLHELGHGVYDKHIDRELPYLLRAYPHLCMTEASAMFFGRLAQDPVWMRDALGLTKAQADSLAPGLNSSLRLKEIIFSRWVQVMFNFERELYRDPEQDLNTLWWDMVEKYQFVKRPEGRNLPDWATKIHIISSPVYYHNYMLGELIASQIFDCIAAGGGAGTDEIGIYGNSAVGEYFREAMYRPGNTLPWADRVKQMTGEPLSAKCFVKQYVEDES